MNDPNVSEAKPLEYRSGQSIEPAPRVRYWAQAAIGFGAVGAAVGLGALLMGTTSRWFGGNEHLWIATWISVPLLMLLVAVLYLRLGWRWKGFLVGVLLGRGIVGLLVGGCFLFVILTLR